MSPNEKLLSRARSIRHIVARAGEIAGIPFPVHPHQLRHACGYYLAAQGQDTRAIQDYLGHKNIHHTVRYTQMSPQIKLTDSTKCAVGEREEATGKKK